MTNAILSPDPLADALQRVRMSGVFYSRAEFTAPWGLALPTLPGTLMFHVVTAGVCWIEVEGAESRPLVVGDLALVSHGQGHRLLGEPGALAANLFDLPHEAVSAQYEVLRHGGGGAPTNLICGAVRFADPLAVQVVASLPPLLVLETAGALVEREWLASALHLMASEARQSRPGSEAVITRLADILVIQAIRTWLAEAPTARAGWLGALRDPQLGSALAAFHRAPGEAWTVATLAHTAAMSRSAFAARFLAVVGEPPMQYVARWRMRLAAAWLREERVTAAEVGVRLGYQSEAAFSRAFKRWTGRAPGATRRLGGPAVGVGSARLAG